MADDVPVGLSRAEGRSFGLTVGAAFVVLAVIGVLRHVTMPLVLGSLGGVLIAGGLMVPGWMVPVRSAWMRLAHGISRVTTPIVMGLIFFLALTPIGLVRRLFGKDTVRRSGAPDTYWKPRAGAPASDMKRQF
jgi:Saxitoxin biosynthesis operon protein SxtJ